MFRRLIIAALLILLTGCAGHEYRGYQTRAYSIRGIRYHPMQPAGAVGYTEEGTASHYKEGWFLFPGKTSTGEKLYPWTKCGAHKTLPLPCRVRVTNLANARSAVIRINDRGPFISGRMLDVTEPVAKKLGFYDQGLARVRIEVLSVGDGKYRIKGKGGFW
ncbi:MAG TPA: septal ring lytic transglycosylase RlpA family protein [Chthoniobacterales bacterium]